jgi:hypothetical protein
VGQHCSQTDTCEDQTALLQSHLASHKSNLGTSAESLNFPKISALTDPTNRKMALAQFEHTALDLAQNREGVTDTVVLICTETAELLNETVLAAIINEHDTDQAMIDTAYAAFSAVENQRLDYSLTITNALAELDDPTGTGWIEQHRSCRANESTACVGCWECQSQCREETERCDYYLAQLELEYRNVLDVIDNHAYCDANGNIHAPSSENRMSLSEHLIHKDPMERYIDAMEVARNCSTPTCEQCPSICSSHSTTRNRCNDLQLTLESEQCQARHSLARYHSLYNQAYTGAENRHNMVETQVRIMEADRKVEWDTLDRVICLLLTLTNPDDGAASSDATAASIEACRTHHVDTTHLDINYYDIPDPGTLPDLPVDPCSEEFETENYESIAFCEGLEAVQAELPHGLLEECTCSAEDVFDPQSEIGFPYDLGPWMLFDTGFNLNVDGGFVVNEAFDSWQVSFNGSSYSSRCSPFSDVSLPDLDEAFGLTGEDSIARVAWAYADPRGTQEMLAYHNNRYPETMQHRFIRLGGFVYLNANNDAVAVKEVSLSTTYLSQASEGQLTLIFGRHVISEAQATEACSGQWHDITMGEFYNKGARKYCWDLSRTLDFCEHGCFTYEMAPESEFAYISFSVDSSISHVTAEHYAATDQQGALEASMITGHVLPTA